MLRYDGCVALSAVMQETNKKLPAPVSRDATITADQVAKLRQAAHARGAKSAALAYAIAFETMLRLWDVTGQWVPTDTLGFSDVVDASRREK